MYSHSLARVFCVGIALACTGLFSTLRAQIPIQGITEEAVYGSGSPPTFQVPAEQGYTYPKVLLDGQRVPVGVDITVTEPGYHTVYVERRALGSTEIESHQVQFILRRAGVGSAEDGLPAWTPYPTIPSSSEEVAEAHLDLMIPSAFPSGMEIPVVGWIRNEEGSIVRANGAMAADGHPSIVLRRGVGSGFLAADHPPGELVYEPSLHGLTGSRMIQIEESPDWQDVSGTLNGDVVWSEDARISVSGNLTIPAGSSLTIEPGVVVRLNSNIDIHVLGRVRVDGTVERPVVFTPVSRAQPWGGFYLEQNTSLLEATGAIFMGAASRQSGFPGHRDEQPLLYIDNGADVTMTNCAAIFLAGQFHHSFDRGTPYSTVTMIDSLIQRCTTAGEFNGCSLTFINSALIEVPYEDQFICDDPDCDHDGFYLNAGNHYLEGSLLGWMKDDCIDAGSGGGPSSVTMTNCWVEGAYHEGCAWSGGSRNVVNLHMVNMNNGAGIEAGWSSGSAASPVVTVRNSLSTGNAIGMRFGDNYDWDYYGFLDVKDSLVLHNIRDVWGMNWDNWMYGINTRDGSFAMDIADNYLGAVNTNHPNNTIWDPSAHAASLLPFMTTPPEAAVGVGFGLWENQMTRDAFVKGVPLRLSSFTTNEVSVDVVVSDSVSEIDIMTVTFAPGETLKHVFPVGLNSGDFQITLENPIQAEITGLAEVTVSGNAIAPTLATALTAQQINLARWEEGIPVQLSQASAVPVTVQYSFAGSGGVVVTGSLEFAPGETLKFLSPEEIDPDNYELLRFNLSDAVGAALGEPSSVYLLETVTVTPLPNVTLIPQEAVWRYRDEAFAAPAGWQGLAFVDDSWEEGPAQLGFGESDQNTTIDDNNQITSYFRHTFMVEDASAFDELRLWMLRDDGGVVYLNGTEIFRSPNLPTGPIDYNTLTLNNQNGENTIDQATLGAGTLRDGMNVLAVEIHQQSPTSSDVSFDFELVGVPTPLPPPPEKLHLLLEDGELTLVWGNSFFRLQKAPAVDGPWSFELRGSPVVIPVDPGNPQMFYRLILLAAP